MNDIKTPLAARNALLGMFLQHHDANLINDFISDLKHEDCLNDAKAYSRLKRDLNNILEASHAEKRELVTELEMSINDIAENAT